MNISLLQIGEDKYSFFETPANSIQAVSVSKTTADEDGKVTVSFEFVLSSKSVDIAVEDFVNRAVDIVQNPRSESAESR